MKCAVCKTDFDGKNYGVITHGTKARGGGFAGSAVVVVDLCSRDCRSAHKQARGKEFAKAVNSGTITVAGGPLNIAALVDKFTGKLEKDVRKALTGSEIRKRLEPKERDVSKSIADQLDGRGIWNTRTQSGKIKLASGHVLNLCKKGTPDRVFNCGLNVWIEVKAPGGVVSDEQRKVLAELKHNGSLGFILDDPHDLDFVLQGIKDHAGDVLVLQKIVRQIQDDIDYKIAQNRKART